MQVLREASAYHRDRARVAQWIERLPPEQKAVGSTPTSRTTPFPLYSKENRQGAKAVTPRALAVCTDSFPHPLR